MSQAGAASDGASSASGAAHDTAADLSAALSGLLAEFRQLKADVAALHAKAEDIDALARHTAAIDRKVDELSASARSAATQAQQAQARVDRLTDVVTREAALRAARDELAELQQRLDGEFGAHEEVRRLARSIIRNAEAGSLDAVLLLAELQQRPLDVPDYWLSPACLAIIRWAAGDRERSEGALRLAMRADPARTALFMALILRPYAPGEDTRQWLTRYLSALAPRALPPEFPQVIDAVAGGAFGPDAAWPLLHQVSRWYREEASVGGAAAEARTTWQQRLRDLGQPADAREFPVLARNLANSADAWAPLDKRLEVAAAFTAASEYFPARFAAAVPALADLSDQLAATLTALATAPLSAEAVIRDRARWLRAFIDSDADRDAADRLADAELPGAPENGGPSRTQDILELVRDQAFPARLADGDNGPPPASATELLAIWASAQLIGQAADLLAVQSPRPRDVRVPLSQPDAADAWLSAIAGQPGGTAGQPSGTGAQPLRGSGPAWWQSLVAWRPGSGRTAQARQQRVVTFSCSTDASVTAEAIGTQVTARQESVGADIARAADERRHAWRRASRASQVALPAAAALGVTAVLPSGVPGFDLIAPAVVLGVPSLAWLALLPGRRRQLARSTEEETERARTEIRAAGDELTVLFERDRAGQERLAALQEFLGTLGPAGIQQATQGLALAGQPPRPRRPRGLPDWTPLPPGDTV